jgi:hypothetical protein
MKGNEMFEQNQIVQYPATLLGAKKFKGDIDGNKIDSCTVLVATQMPFQTGNAVGFTAANMRFGDSDNFKRLENLKFPIAVVITVEMTSTGKGLSPVLRDFSVQPQAPAKS